MYNNINPRTIDPSGDHPAIHTSFTMYNNIKLRTIDPSGDQLPLSESGQIRNMLGAHVVADGPPYIAPIDLL